MISAQRLTHWSIPVADLEESEAFYGGFLGLEYRGRLGNGRAAVYRVGDSDFIVWECGQPTDPAVREAGVHYAFTVSPEVWEEAIGEIHERGIPLHGPIVYRARGVFLGREVYVLDPSGNVVELTDPTWHEGLPTPTFEELNGIGAVVR
ncbi:MAG TPA: VOC family protein [Acidimicrobiales bacterium]|nr:VOC family protein [Acidimicrobiales bacterium]